MAYADPEVARRKAHEWVLTPEMRAIKNKRRTESHKRNLERDHDSVLRTRFGITVDQYNAMLARQSGLCDVCRKPETATRHGNVIRLTVDHDHKTGKVRGLICVRCNLALGHAGDDTDTLTALIQYLRKHQQEKTVIERRKITVPVRRTVTTLADVPSPDQRTIRRRIVQTIARRRIGENGNVDVKPNGDLSAPMPWFGGKSRIANQIWQRLDGKSLDCYLEPCMGSAAPFLTRPLPIRGREILNDYDSLLVNAYRSIQRDPDVLAEICCSILRAESELHAIHAHLTSVRDEMRSRVEGDPDYYDVKLGAWWLWGIGMKLGGGWCSGEGPWHVVGGKLVCLENGDSGRNGNGITRSVPCVGNRGVLRQSIDELKAWMRTLSNRLKNALILNGDWSRAVTPAFMGPGNVGILFDPPYGAEADYNSTLYTSQDADISTKIKAWCVEWGRKPTMRIVYCGYQSGVVGTAGGEGGVLEHAGWKRVFWKASGGYGNQGQANEEKAGGKLGNRFRECYWYSPHCNRDNDLFGF